AEVDGEHRVELLGGGLQEIAADGDADVVDEQMERGERARRGFDGAATLLFAADVGGDRVRAPASVANCRGGLLRELERAIGDHYGRTFARAHYRGGAVLGDGEFIACLCRSVCAAADD